MSNKRPWMPLYIADYLKDTTHLGALESGGYIHLIMDYWQHGELPDDDRQLARIAKMTPAEWKRSKHLIQQLFLDGWKHKRVDKELAKTEEISSKRSAAASARQDAIRVQKESKSTAPTPAKDHTLHTSHFTPPLGEGENAPPKAVLQVGLGSQIDPEFEPSPEAIDRAHQQGATDEDIDSEVRKFIATHQVKATFSPNWDASFAKWWEHWKPHRDRVEKPKAPPRVEVNSGPFAPSDADWGKAVAKWLMNESLWPRQLGNAPGSTSCKCPPEILRKHGIDPTTGAKLREAAE